MWQFMNFIPAPSQVLGSFEALLPCLLESQKPGDQSSKEEASPNAGGVAETTGSS